MNKNELAQGYGIRYWKKNGLNGRGKLSDSIAVRSNKENMSRIKETSLLEWRMLFLLLYFIVPLLHKIHGKIILRKELKVGVYINMIVVPICNHPVLVFLHDIVEEVKPR